MLKNVLVICESSSIVTNERGIQILPSSIRPTRLGNLKIEPHADRLLTAIDSKSVSVHKISIKLKFEERVSQKATETEVTSFMLRTRN